MPWKRDGTHNEANKRECREDSIGISHPGFLGGLFASTTEGASKTAACSVWTGVKCEVVLGISRPIEALKSASPPCKQIRQSPCSRGGC